MTRTILQYGSLKASPHRFRPGAMPDRWDLSQLLKDPLADFDMLMKELDAHVSEFETWRERLDPKIALQDFSALLSLNGRIAERSAKLSGYAYLWFSEDTMNQQGRAFKARVEERLTSLHNRTLFFDLWWQQVNDADAARLLDAPGDLRYHLESIRRLRTHTLSEPEEKVINLKDNTGRHAINTLYDVLTNGLVFTLPVGGKKKRLTREQLSPYLRSSQARLREASYKELFRRFSASRDVIGEMYMALVKDWGHENLDLRKFSVPIAARNFGNDIPDEAVSALLSVCMKNTDVFQEYFRIKGRLCNIKRMNRYHIYAPHRADRKHYRYADAVVMVLEAYRSFSPRMADLAEQVFTQQRIDARARPGKLSGAYCYSVAPGLTPYVLLNYTGETRDIATLAHELGHAVHGMLAAHHSIFTFQATLPLAETASVFGERILSDALMAQETNRAVKQGLLLAQLDDLYATVLRQAFFVLFENAAHEMAAQGGTVEDLAAAYWANLRQQFGKAVAVPDEFRWEWLTIPHIFGSPFYCYAYSFGNLLVLALYRRYQQQGTSFTPKYLDLLAAGGSKNPTAILAEVGMDLRSEPFWQSGFDTIKGMVNELERTMG